MTGSSAQHWFGFSGAILFGAIALGCGGSKKPAEAAEQVVAGKRDDQSRCEYKGRDDRDAMESSAPGSIVANVRRVYGYIGTATERRRILLCREVDTNLDGVKDLLHTYGDNGERLTEQADTNYDGKIDTWITFGRTRPAKLELDKDGDGQAEEVRFYTAGKLARVQRDTNHDEKADIFEIYDEGRLERMGLDVDFDGKVDTWRRDNVYAREQEEKERSAAATMTNEPTAAQGSTP
ncbi:MAG TPA: hypothetical protein VN764_11285 [Polyangiaceae bacterium]|nr:hypothetical protein [Polyangiaceae bacterium]